MSKKPKHKVSGLTDVEERQRCKAAIRKVWARTSRVKCIKENRIPHPDPNSRFQYAVVCVHCNRVYGQHEKIYYKTKTGRRRKTSPYHVNHICLEGMPPVDDLVTDLGTYAEALLHTPCEIVCVDCHGPITKQQMNKKYNKE